MDDPIPVSVDALMRFREAAPESLAKFRQYKHDKYLCPRCERQLNRVLDCFEKHRLVAYDQQGLRDQGTDVTLRYSMGMDFIPEKVRYICVQIKSFDDLNKADCLTKLKSQLVDAQNRHADRLAHYFILLCTDPEMHAAKIREIKNFFVARGLLPETWSMWYESS